jgi:pyruvate/2-oxoglutarate dehydrogenase complex dihydrolipoamide dehydrogenase (E3) component
VTVIDRNERLMSREDEDVCQALSSVLEDDGIDLVLNARIKRVSGRSGESVSVVLEQSGAKKVVEGSHILVATGRTPNTEGLGLELAGIELTDRGYIKANERLKTTASNVWAIGEVAGSPQFTHISIDDFRVVHSNITGGSRATTGRQVLYCLFTDPELARIGLSDREATAQGIAYRLFKVPMQAVLRAHTLSETRGFLKALVEADGDRVLGFTAFGVGAGEIMAVAQIAMIAGLPYTALRDAVLTHPTLCEGLIPLFSSIASAHQVAGARVNSAV